MSFLNPLYELIARIIVGIHSGLAPVFGAGSGWSWGLAIVLLTMLMRLLLFPLFVKQIKTQRAMQTLQPRLKELQAKYKGDREKLNAEMMKLYREHGANPLTGCLPLLLQMPVFFALFHVLSRIRPDSAGNYHPVSGISVSLVESAAHAKIFGAPIAASFKSSAQLLATFDASTTTVKVVAAVMVVLMGATTFWTQRQLMARTAAASGTAVASQQKILLYVLPFTFLFAGFNFPIGVLLYWLTTNVWSMAQQHFVIAKMNAYAPGATPPPTPAPRAPRFSRGKGAGPASRPVETPPVENRDGKPATPPSPAPAPSPATGSTPAKPPTGATPLPADGPRAPVGPRGAGDRRPPGARRRSNRRGRR